jgi:hypothetical protein
MIQTRLLFVLAPGVPKGYATQALELPMEFRGLRPCRKGLNRLGGIWLGHGLKFNRRE